MAPENHDRRRSDDEFKITLIRKLDAIEAGAQAMKVQIEDLSKRIEHANSNTKAFKTMLDEDVQKLTVAIQGDESENVIGMAATLKTLSKECFNHFKSDNWGFGIMISLMVTILGWTIFHS
jgi:hypothetical protein